MLHFIIIIIIIIYLFIFWGGEGVPLETFTAFQHWQTLLGLPQQAYTNW